MIENDSNNVEIIVKSPGRINFIGEHTDYNNGFVLPTAIDRNITFRLSKNNSYNKCYVYSGNYNADFLIDLENVKISNVEWENYILGVIYEIQKLTNKVRGFDCKLVGNIPMGSGISSSAALECGLAIGLNELFDLGFSKLDIVKLSQRAEHNYVGTKCGIMDQYSSVLSKKDHVILLDCRSLEHEYIPININPYEILLLNTNVSHNLASSEYNTRRAECEKGVGTINKKYKEVDSLRDVNINMLEEFKLEMTPTIYARCQYVIEEEERVLGAVEALREGRQNDLGYLMYQTHEGLSKKYEVSCPELDFLVDYTKNYNSIIGARMMGGGFGGCTINLIHKEAISDFVSQVSKAYFNKFKRSLDAFSVKPSEGTTIVDKKKELKF